MAFRSHAWTLGGLLVPTVVLTTGCPQPQMKCRSAQGSYAMRYEGDTTCLGRGGDIIGLRTYNPGATMPDFTNIGVALQVHTMGVAYDYARDRDMLGDATEDDIRTSGTFASPDPDDDDLCYIDDLGTTSLQLPEIPPAEITERRARAEASEEPPPDPGQPAIDIAYTWTNFRIVASPAVQGLQFSVDATYRDNLQGCTSSFTAVGLNPEVPCTEDVACTESENIPSDFPVSCSTEIGRCVLQGMPPSYQ